MGPGMISSECFYVDARGASRGPLQGLLRSARRGASEVLTPLDKVFPAGRARELRNGAAERPRRPRRTCGHRTAARGGGASVMRSFSDADRRRVWGWRYRLASRPSGRCVGGNRAIPIGIARRHARRPGRGRGVRELSPPTGGRGMYPRMSCRRHVLDSIKLLLRANFSGGSLRWLVPGSAFPGLEGAFALPAGRWVTTSTALTGTNSMPPG